MVCQDVEMMIRVARAGARKMFAQGYSYLHTEIGGWFTMITPNGVRYNVAIYESGADCDCEFHTSNLHLPGTTCKHIEFIRDEEAQIAIYEQGQIEREEANFFGDYRF